MRDPEILWGRRAQGATISAESETRLFNCLRRHLRAGRSA